MISQRLCSDGLAIAHQRHGDYAATLKLLRFDFATSLQREPSDRKAIFHSDFTVIAQRSCSDWVVIAKRFCDDFAAIAKRIRADCASTSQPFLSSDCTVIA